MIRIVRINDMLRWWYGVWVEGLIGCMGAIDEGGDDFNRGEFQK